MSESRKFLEVSQELKCKIGRTGEMPYRLYVPEEAGSKSLPILLFLHGAGERGDDNIAQVNGNARIVHNLMEEKNQKKNPCIIIAPQCPKDKWWPRPVIVNGLMRLVKEIQKKYKADADRFYVTGLSMGGYGTWAMLAKYAAKIAAAVPICGGGNLNFTEVFKYIPIWVFHGDADNVVRPEQSRIMVDALRKLGSGVKYTEYPGVGHDSWTPAYSEEELIPWLFAQSKK